MKIAFFSVRFLFVFIALSVGASQAAILPYGVQNDVALTTVLDDWGWNEIYRGDYGLDNLLLSDVFDGHGSHIMLAAQQQGSSDLELLAAVAWADFITYTPENQTKSLNGAEWYYNGGALGFADLGQPILQANCDLYDASDKRLCWHTEVSAGVFDYTQVPVFLDNGFRAGSNLDLSFGATGWDRVVFTANLTAIPIGVPAGLLYASGVLVFALRKTLVFS